MTTVTSQDELDAALADTSVTDISIKSPRGVWLELGSHQKDVSAFGSASVSASGSASVRAFDSASVRAFGSASVSAFDSASVSAFDSASVRAFDSASVRASGSASVSACKYVAVHLHSQRVTVVGGVVIDCTSIDMHDPSSTATCFGSRLPAWLDHDDRDVEDILRACYLAERHGYDPYLLARRVLRPLPIADACMALERIADEMNLADRVGDCKHRSEFEDLTGVHARAASLIDDIDAHVDVIRADVVMDAERLVARARTVQA